MSSAQHERATHAHHGEAQVTLELYILLVPNALVQHCVEVFALKSRLVRGCDLSAEEPLNIYLVPTYLPYLQVFIYKKKTEQY